MLWSMGRMLSKHDVFHLMITHLQPIRVRLVSCNTIALQVQNWPSLWERLCQFLSSLIDQHWLAMKRVLRYLQGTTNMGITIVKSSSLDLLDILYVD